jgi:hypothetical protein
MANRLKLTFDLNDRPDLVEDTPIANWQDAGLPVRSFPGSTSTGLIRTG